MPSSLKLSAIVLAALLASDAASAEERCSGTLCDFYYGSSSPEEQPAAKPAAPTPLMVPSFLSRNPQAGATPSNGAAAAPPSRFQVQGGGLVGLLKGQPAERCSGTLCDFYYGGPPPEKPEATATAEPQAAPETATDEREEAPSSRRRRGYETAEREAKARCATTAQDPWHCYR